MLASTISRLSENDEAGNPDSIILQMFSWGTKMLESIGPDFLVPMGPKYRCNMHLGCPAQRQHVNLPLVSAGTKHLQPGTCGQDSEIGLFTIITGERGATIRVIRCGMNFMNAPHRTFEAAAAAKDAMFSHLYSEPYLIAVMRNNLPYSGD